MERDKVKQNINFLEYPLWFQDEVAAASAEKGMIWQDREGYIYRAGYKPPVKTDAIFLLYLLMQSQRQNYKQELSLTRYQVLHDCGLDDSAKSYSRLEDSLKRWKMVGVEFAGTFYDGESYSAINFGIVDSWSIHEKTKELKVVFSPSFIKMMLGKGFFKYINFSEFKKLRSPLATRLYEILCKTFHGRDSWEINAIKMAEKIPMKERYPAHIVPKIKSAINRINRCTDKKFLLETRQVTRGQIILCFKKDLEAKSIPTLNKSKEQVFVIPEKPEIKELVSLLPESRQSQKTIIELVIAYYEMYGSIYVARNICYTNKNAKKSYRPYLLKAMQHDYGLAMQEDEEAKRQETAQEAQKASEAAKKEAEELRRRQILEEDKKRAQAYIESLTAEAKTGFETESIANMAENIREIFHRKGPGSKIMLILAMEKLALQKLGTSAEKQPIQQTLDLAA